MAKKAIQKRSKTYFIDLRAFQEWLEEIKHNLIEEW